MLRNPLSQDEISAPAVVKRGRPAKNAPVTDANGTVILTEAEHEELNMLLDDIRGKTVKIQKLLLSGIQKYFRMGEILHQVEKRATCRMTVQMYEEKTGVPARMVTTAMTIYKTYKDRPQVLESLTVREAAMLIGEKKEAKKNGEEPVHVEYPLPEGQITQTCDDEFGLPTASGINLSTFRVHTDRQSGHLYLIKKGFHAAVPVAQLTVESPKTPVMENAYAEFLNEVQIATERYYSVVEQNSGEYDG